MTNEVDDVNTTNNVFKGSGSGLFTTIYKRPGQKRNLSMRPEQVDGDITVSDYSGTPVSQRTPSLQRSPDTLQTIYD